MKITFRSRKLENCYREAKKAEREFGAQVARKFIQRITLIQAATSLEEIMQLPGLRCHQLKGDRAGQYAVKLTGFVRLIFTVEDRQLDILMIEEVSKHYGD